MIRRLRYNWLQKFIWLVEWITETECIENNQSIWCGNLFDGWGNFAGGISLERRFTRDYLR